MSAPINDTVAGVITIAGLPDEACFTTFKELLAALPSYLQVQIPSSVIGVVVGSDYPNEDQRDMIWLRRDASGNDLGVYTFQKGTWRPAYNFAPGQIIWVYSADGSTPEGFKKVDASNSAVPAFIANGLQTTYLQNQTGVEVYFAVTYIGFN